MSTRLRYCDECNCEREVKVLERMAIYTFKKEPFEILERYAKCCTCGNDVSDQELDTQTLQKLSFLYEKKKATT